MTTTGIIFVATFILMIVAMFVRLRLSKAARHDEQGNSEPPHSDEHKPSDGQKEETNVPLPSDDSQTPVQAFKIGNAKDGDVLTLEDGNLRYILIFEGIANNGWISAHGYYWQYDDTFHDRTEEFCHLRYSHTMFSPATDEDKRLLTEKMREAGYEWDAATRQVVRVAVGDPSAEQEQEPAAEPQESAAGQTTVDPAEFADFVDYFSELTDIPAGGTVHAWLSALYSEAVAQYYNGSSQFGHPLVFDKANFPVVCDYWRENEGNPVLAFRLMCAWAAAMMFAELCPERRDMIYKAGYDYCGKGKDMPTYGYSFECDPNVARICGAALYTLMRDEKLIDDMRNETGGSTITYRDIIDEVYVDTSSFMPAAPYPYINGFGARQEYPVEGIKTHEIDTQIHHHISKHYSLDSDDYRQDVIQAIANKEHYVQHLFGGDRTVVDETYGEMTFHPVFGKHNIGVEIPAEGAIAALANAVGMPSSWTRDSLLEAQYGRRRPGQDILDPSSIAEKSEKALVNYTIEEGDGHTTGYYNKDGEYVDNNGNYIGDYETYFQGCLYANSYPSGHSAYIMGVALALIEVMPDRADAILRAANEFALSRTITRYHWTSDTIHGRVIGSTMIPILHALTNADYGIGDKLEKAKQEYKELVKKDE